MKLKSRQKKRGFVTKSRILIVGSFILIIIISFLISKFFVIKSIQINLNNVNCVDEGGVKSILGLQGKNIILTNFNNLEDKVKRKFICVKDVNFQKKLPEKVLVNIDGRTAVATVRTALDASASANIDLSNDESSGSATPSAQIIPLEEGTPFLVDDQGIVFAQADDTNLPSILLAGSNVSLGKGLKDDLISKSVQILQKIKTYNLVVNWGVIYQDNSFLVETNPKLLFNLSKDINVQLASLQLILDKAKIENEKMDFVDLRFDKPVVKFASKEKK